MIIQFSFWGIDEISPDGSEMSNDIITRKSPIAPERIECKTLFEAEAARLIYIEKARATGKCGRVLTHKVGFDRSFSDYNKFEAKSILVNREVALVQV
jgi:hypothetical protein